MICKICGQWFKPYSLTNGKIIVEAYICERCMKQKVEEFIQQSASHLLVTGELTMDNLISLWEGKVVREI